MSNKDAKPRKFRVKDYYELEAITFQLMIRRVDYYVRPIMIKGKAVLEVVTRTELTDGARKEILDEAKKK